MTDNQRQNKEIRKLHRVLDELSEFSGLKIDDLKDLLGDGVETLKNTDARNLKDLINDALNTDVSTSADANNGDEKVEKDEEIKERKSKTKENKKEEPDCCEAFDSKEEGDSYQEDLVINVSELLRNIESGAKQIYKEKTLESVVNDFADLGYKAFDTLENTIEKCKNIYSQEYDYDLDLEDGEEVEIEIDIDPSSDLTIDDVLEYLSSYGLDIDADDVELYEVKIPKKEKSQKDVLRDKEKRSKEEILEEIEKLLDELDN